MTSQFQRDSIGPYRSLCYLSFISLDRSRFFTPANKSRNLRTRNLEICRLTSLRSGGSGCPRKLRSRTRVQRAAQVVRRMGRSLKFIPSFLSAIKDKMSGFFLADKKGSSSKPRKRQAKSSQVKSHIVSSVYFQIIVSICLILW